ncbi:MAG TPA: hypothetical protein VKA68_05335, partial [bacterium]|nr:hypothetical protein [bacterium]
MPTIEEVVRQQSEVVSDQIQELSGWAESEEDLRIETEKVLGEFKREAKLPELRGRHEVTIGKGRADSVYNYVIIEYKKPGRLTDDNDSPGNKEVIKQIKQRIQDLEKEENRKIEKLFGVGFDGHYFVFVRYRNNEWMVYKPVPVTRQTTERFLRALLALAASGRAFQPEYLAGDFGSDAPLARGGIQTFYRAIMNTGNP